MVGRLPASQSSVCKRRCRVLIFKSCETADVVAVETSPREIRYRLAQFDYRLLGVLTVAMFEYGESPAEL